MKNRKSLIIIIMIIFVLIICVICAILLLQYDETDQTLSEEDAVTRYLEEGIGDPLEVEYVAKEVNDPTKFFSVEDCIKNNFDENFVAEDMYILDKDSIASYSVKGKIEGEDAYFFVVVDKENMTYSIEELYQVSDLDEIDLDTDITEISDNGNNTFEYTTVSTEEMCRKYLEDFVEKELSNPEEAYNMIDEEYKDIRFPTFEDYQEYLELCQEMIETAVLSEYNVEISDEYREYTLVDNYNNSYTVKAQGVWNYTILLDNYTIKLDTYEENYSNLSDEQKVQANAYIFLQMINTKDYSHAYEKLDETFRNNNFSTLDEFKEYVNNNFFTYNLAITSSADINAEGNVYVYEISIKSGSGSAAEKKELTIIMQLLEDTDYVMSFSIE